MASKYRLTLWAKKLTLPAFNYGIQNPRSICPVRYFFRV